MLLRTACIALPLLLWGEKVTHAKTQHRRRKSAKFAKKEYCGDGPPGPLSAITMTSDGCGGGTGEIKLERYRGIITGYQNREFVGAVSLNETSVLSVGSVTTGDLYRITGDSFPPNGADGNPVLPDAGDKIGTFIIDVTPTKPYFDNKGDKAPKADYNLAHALITLCEIKPLFGGCATFTHGGDWETPAKKDDAGAIVGFPDKLNDVSYTGSLSSTVGAATYRSGSRSKGYVHAQYNANEANELDAFNAFYTGLEYSLAYEDRANIADTLARLGLPADFAGDGKVIRQVRDFKVLSQKLTPYDLNEFFDLASEFEWIMPAEAKIDGKFGRYPSVPTGLDRAAVINTYLQGRYGI